MNTDNQKVPYIYRYKSLLALDLWEQKYYLNYYDKYSNNFFSIINLNYASEKE